MRSYKALKINDKNISAAANCAVWALSVLHLHIQLIG
jgi:hypothetical protein